MKTETDVKHYKPKTTRPWQRQRAAITYISLVIVVLATIIFLVTHYA